MGTYVQGRQEQVSSAPPPGAGRIRDLNYPDYTTAGTVLASLTNLRSRITGAAFGGVVNTFTTFTGNWQFFNGCDLIQLVGGAAGEQGGSISWSNQVNINVRTSNVAYWPADDDWNVHRVVWIGCMNGSISTDNDMGVELLNVNSAAAGGIIRVASPSNGFGIRFGTGGTNGTVQFVTRNVASGLVNSTLATDGVGGFNILQLHSYEMRIFSALPNVPASVQVWIDDILTATFPFSASRMPQNGESGATGPGWFPTLICNSANTAGMFTKYLGFQAGPTIAACF